MAQLYEHAFFDGTVIPIGDARLSVTSSAVLYGLSVYTVFPVIPTEKGFAAFRLADHFKRLIHSATIIGIDTPPDWTLNAFTEAVADTVRANNPTEKVFARATLHVTALVPGTRSRGLSVALSIFLYEATPILPPEGVRLKTSVWRRVPDYAIPSRAKVNGAYVNSVLAKQDAIDSGYDDCIFLDTLGHVCELSAANLFLVRDGTLITPSTSSDALEGITRRTIIELARDAGISCEEREVDLTELYIADEVFATGTSAFVASVSEIDRRRVATPSGPLTTQLRSAYESVLRGDDDRAIKWLMYLK
jgi:branched-chain amino acid aminotransferase